MRRESSHSIIHKCSMKQHKYCTAPSIYLTAQVTCKSSWSQSLLVTELTMRLAFIFGFRDVVFSQYVSSSDLLQQERKTKDEVFRHCYGGEKKVAFACLTSSSYFVPILYSTTLFDYPLFALWESNKPHLCM